MRSHDECEAAINAALADRRDGFAYFLAERCDQRHGDLAPTPEHDPDPADVARAADEMEDA